MRPILSLALLLSFASPALAEAKPPPRVVVVREDGKRVGSVEQKRIERAVERCERRGSEWARQRCSERAGR